MFLTGIFGWWYSDGIRSRIKSIIDRLSSSADFFSIELLISTLFAPYRQISADGVVGPIGDQIRAFFDKILSRFIGAFMRTFMIIIGLIIMAAQAVFGVLVLLFWVVLPILPVVGLIMTVIGWVPKWLI